MEIRKRVVLAMAVMFAALLCVVAILIIYDRTHHGPPPTSIFFLIPAFMLCGSVIAFRIVRGGRTRSQTEIAAGFSPHRSWMTKAIKAGLVIYVLGLLNGIRLVAEHAIPLKYAVVGFTICIALIAAHWRALGRLDKIKKLATTPGAQVK
jgi:hypothetical protein